MALQVDRGDQATAEHVLQRLIRDEEKRAQALRICAEIAAAAGEVNAASWSTTLVPRQITVNVGQLLALRVSRDMWELAVDETLVEKLGAFANRAVVTYEFQVMPGVRTLGWPLDTVPLGALLEALRDTKFALARIAAAKSNAPWRRGHSAGFAKLLELALGRPIPGVVEDERSAASRPIPGVVEDERSASSDDSLPRWILPAEPPGDPSATTLDVGLPPEIAGVQPRDRAVLVELTTSAQFWALAEIVAIDGDAPRGVRLRLLQRVTPPIPFEQARRHFALTDLELLPWTLAPEQARALLNVLQRREAPRIVKIAVGGDFGIAWEECLERGEIGVDWDKIGDLRLFRDKQHFKRVFSELYAADYNGHAGAIGRKANELWTLRELQPGDRVIANRGMSTVLGVGKVLPAAYVFDGNRKHFKHTVRVAWDTSVAGRIQKQPYWGFTTVDDVSPELYQAITRGEAELALEPPPVTRPETDSRETPTPPQPSRRTLDDLLRMIPTEDDPQSGTVKGVEFIAQALFDRAHLVYPLETLTAFILALQTRRFVVLSGISGTGKTQLAQAFAAFVGEMLGVADNVATIVVQPDWTDHRGLMGYENVISGKYVETEALHLIRRAYDEFVRAAEQRRTPAPFFLILDEMNLARVEHYLADFLSVIESHRALRLHHHEAALGGVPATIEVPPNLCIVGTVNVDDTTYMFSPKVLDRTFVLELGHVDLHSFGARPIEPRDDELVLHAAPLELTALRRSSAVDWEQFGRLEQGELRRLVLDLHGLLDEHGRGFGYRIAGELARFVAIYEWCGYDDPRELTAALDLAILMKVLPRLHGTQQELDPVLLRLLDFACTGQSRTGAGTALDAWRMEKGRLVPRAGGTAARLPRSALKLHRMLQRVRQRGFVAYIE